MSVFVFDECPLKKSIDLKQKYVLQYPEKKNVYTIGYFNAIKWNQITEKITGKEE